MKWLWICKHPDSRLNRCQHSCCPSLLVYSKSLQVAFPRFVPERAGGTARSHCETASLCLDTVKPYFVEEGMDPETVVAELSRRCYTDACKPQLGLQPGPDLFSLGTQWPLSLQLRYLSKNRGFFFFPLIVV